MSSENWMQLLQRVSRALGITTKAILDNRGVVGDFHGDATMGFWGWPFAQKDQAIRACRAALAIEREFQRLAMSPEDPLYGFEMGLGIATGLAVAGQIGTEDQTKVTAFGPVVDLASRLESMNRQLHTSILMDRRTAEKLHEGEESAVSEVEREDLFQVRRIGRVLPMGGTQTIEVHQLQPLDESLEGRTGLAVFSEAVTAFERGEWEQAHRKLLEVPDTDRVKALLTGLMTQYNCQAPADWDGVIRLPVK